MQRLGSQNPVTPMKPPRNDGASHDNPDAEIPLTQSDEEEEDRPKQKRKRAPRVLATYEIVQRWLTGDRAEQSEVDIERENFENARRLMHLSGLKNFPVTNILILCGKRPAHTHHAA
jgi:hypothetical protein